LIVLGFTGSTVGGVADDAVEWIVLGFRDPTVGGVVDDVEGPSVLPVFGKTQAEEAEARSAKRRTAERRARWRLFVMDLTSMIYGVPLSRKRAAF